MKIKDYFDTFTTFTGKVATMVAAGFWIVWIGGFAILFFAMAILTLLGKVGVPLVEDMADYLNTIWIYSTTFFKDWIWYAIGVYAGGIVVLGTIDYLIRRYDK